LVRNTVIYISSNVIKLVASLIVTLPMVTFYLSVEQIGVYAYIALLSSFLMIPLSSGGQAIVASHYFTSDKNERKKMFFHIYVVEIIIKILLFIIVVFFGEQFLKIAFHEYKNEYINYLLIYSASLIFSATKPILYYFFTVERKAGIFFFYNTIEVILNLFFITLFFYFLELGLIGYFLSALFTSFIIFLLDVYTMSKNFIIGFDRQWVGTIYHKGFKLFYVNLLEQFLNLYDSYIVQRFLNLNHLGVYSHAKQYIGNFSMVDNAFFYSYLPSYMRMLNKEEKIDTFKIMLAWYCFLLCLGICIIFFAKDVIGYLTHGKLTQSAELVPLLFVLIFFKSNQRQYSSQLLYYKRNKEYANLSVFANILGFLILTIGVFVYDSGLYFIVFSYILNVVLRNIFIKSYAIYKYRHVDISELFFIVSLAIYIFLLIITWR
jgi:O-antigen/teichoic acid export membrane protein